MGLGPNRGQGGGYPSSAPGGFPGAATTPTYSGGATGKLISLNKIIVN